MKPFNLSEYLENPTRLDGVHIFYPDGKEESRKEYDLFFADEKEELTEFEKAVKQVMWTAYNYDDCSNGRDVDDISNVKATSKTLLNLAMKEILEEFRKMYETWGKPKLGEKTIELFKNYMQDEHKGNY